MFRWPPPFMNYNNSAPNSANSNRKRQFDVTEKQLRPPAGVVPVPPVSQSQSHINITSNNDDDCGPSDQKQKFSYHNQSFSTPNVHAQADYQNQAKTHAFNTVRDKLHKRNWWYINGREKKSTSNAAKGITLTVGTYNVLAQNLLEENMFLYKNCEDERVLSWDYRKEQLLREIQRYQFDVLCLQEVYQPHYDEFFFPQLSKLGYVGVYKKRTGDKLDGCATFFRSGRLEIVDCSAVEYYRPGITFLDRDNVGIVMVLRTVATATRPSSTLCVANTHLLYNVKRGELKLAQLTFLFSEIDRLSFRRQSEDGSVERCPVIVCGDFNLTPFSELYKFIVEGSLRYEGLLARVMSGQDYSTGSNWHVPRELLPEAAGIANTCQFVHELQKRAAKTINLTTEGEDKSSRLATTEEEKARVGVKELSVDEHSARATNSELSTACNTGTLSHSLNLVSAYNHFWSSAYNHEVTTVQQGTVDYIFYSVASKQVRRHQSQLTVDNVVEKELRLTATLNLLLKNEMHSLGALPNSVNASDHLLLAAKFFL